MPKTRNVLTTGQVAKVCNVAPRTVSKWFDSGQLRGYRIPGSRDRRIPLDQLISFMKAHGMPLNRLDTGKTRVLVLDDDPEINGMLCDTLAADGGFDVACARSAFEAGLVAEGIKPQILIVDVSLPDVRPERLCRDLQANADLQPLKLIATGGALTEGNGQRLLQSGFDAYIPKPFDAQRIINTINDLLEPRY